MRQMADWLVRPLVYAARQRGRYGEVFTARIDPIPWVMLGDPDDVRTVFTAGPQRTNAGEANEILRPTLGSHSLLLLDGEEHMRQRKLMLPAFHGERVEHYRTIMREATERAVAAMPAGEAFALRPHTQAITLEVIMRAVFGVEDAAAMARLGVPLKRFVDWAGNPGALMMVALLGFEHPVVRRLLRQRYLGPVDRELYALIAERRAAPDLAERDDVLSMLLLARDEHGEPMTEVELRDELMTLLVAGHETTATSLAWAVERLVRHPGGLERLTGDPAYVDAVVKEILRLRPVVAIVLRRLLEPLEVGGHELPAGATVAPCILLVHRREDVYPEPEAFRPERFLDRAPGTYSWIPFGGGVRRCLGAAFAQVEMQVVLQTLAESVRLQAVGGAEPVRRRGITLAPARGGQVRALAAR
jgi:cytochrome P450